MGLSDWLGLEWECAAKLGSGARSPHCGSGEPTGGGMPCACGSGGINSIEEVGALLKMTAEDKGSAIMQPIVPQSVANTWQEILDKVESEKPLHGTNLLNRIVDKRSYPGAAATRAELNKIGERWLKKMAPGVNPRTSSDGKGRLSKVGRVTYFYRYRSVKTYDKFYRIGNFEIQNENGVLYDMHVPVLGDKIN